MQNFIIVWAVIPGTLLKLILFLGVPLAILLLYLLVRGTHAARIKFLIFRQRNIDDLVFNSNHPPVLYLRPFSIDGTGKRSHEIDLSKFKFKINLGKLDLEFSELNFEVNLAKKCEKIGPFVAIGDPKGSIGENFGAAREYFTDDEWQSKALEKMKYSCMIIMRASKIDSPGVEWELANITHNYLNKTVFLLESTGSLQIELVKRLQSQYPVISKISDASFPCYLEFLDDHQISFKKDISQTSLYRQLIHLSKINKHNMYCGKCGEANNPGNEFCIKCGRNLKQQHVERKPMRFNPFISFITGDSGFFLIALINMITSGMWYWYDQNYANQSVTGNNLYLTMRIVTMIFSIAYWAVLIFFTVKVWRQLFILLIALLLLGRDMYNFIMFIIPAQ